MVATSGEFRNQYERRSLAGVRRIASQLVRNPPAMASLFVVILLSIVVIAGGRLATHEYFEIDLSPGARFAGPSSEHFFGTDGQGRDVYSRVILGTRTSLALAVVAVLISLLGGIVLGAVPAVISAAFDMVIQRFVDLIQAFPGLVLIIFLISVFGRSFLTLVTILSLIFVASSVRVIRSVTLSIIGLTYIEAARTIGASDARVVVRHVLPNLLPIVIVLFSIQVGAVILIEASLSFLGFGPPPPAPSWGRMLSEAQAEMRLYPHLAIFPGLAIVLTVLALNLLGDWLRDVLDPRMRSGN